MGEQAFVVNGDIQKIINALSLLPLKEREKILYLAQHPEELKDITSFEEIVIASIPDQTP